MKSRMFRLTMILGLLVLFTMSCEETEDPDLVTPEDSLAATAALDSAHNSLEDLMSSMYEEDPDSLEQLLDMMDFSEPYALYARAHMLDHRNTEASFGFAFTGFLMISQDQALQDMLLRWESYFSVNEPFLIEKYESPLGKRGYGLPTDVSGIRVPIAPLVATPFALSKMSVDDVPQFSEFQALVGSLFLPVIDESIEALESIEDSLDFVFIISPAMQGEPEASDIELDLTEIYAIETGLYGLKSLLKTVVAYNFEFVSFDSAGIVTELSQDSDFVTLYDDHGAEDLDIALESALTAFDKALAALAFLEGESDDQDNDFIQVEDDFDFNMARDDLTTVKSALEGPTMFHYDYWDEDMYYEDSTRIDISQFFLNPINDFKDILPPYTVGTEIDYSYDYYSVSEYLNLTQDTVMIDGLSNTNISITLHYYMEGVEPTIFAMVNLGFIQYDLSTASQSDLPQVIWEYYAEFMDYIEQYSSELVQFPLIDFYWSGNVTTGESLVIEGYFEISYEQRTAAYVYPTINWNTTDYSTWVTEWTNPTINGILPDLDAAGLVEFLGMNEDNWND